MQNHDGFSCLIRQSFMLLISRNETVFRKFTDILIMKKRRKNWTDFTNGFQVISLNDAVAKKKIAFF